MVRVLAKLDWLKAVSSVPFQDLETPPSGLSWCDLDAAAYLRTGGGRLRPGFYALRHLCWRIPLLLPLVPVLWLPFIFQDMRPGRRSGILIPRFGINDLVRPTSGYRRHVSNIGYYFAINDYLDLQASLDWFSGSYTAINGQVREIADSSQVLNVSVEESSSSVLELGAAGEELNETASVLSARVNEVSSSIEQMVRSVKQVSENTEALAEAAVETSASMGEMATSMREVDASAEETARLSDEVVTLAESGTFWHANGQPLPW